MTAGKLRRRPAPPDVTAADPTSRRRPARKEIGG
jgi:hypothetical protein